MIWSLDDKDTFQECPSCINKSGHPYLCATCRHNRSSIENLKGELMILNGLLKVRHQRSIKKSMQPRTLEELAKELEEWKHQADLSFTMLKTDWERMAAVAPAAAPKDERDWIYKHLDDKFTALRGGCTCECDRCGKNGPDNCKDCRLANIESEITDLLKRAEEL